MKGSIIIIAIAVAIAGAGCGAQCQTEQALVNAVSVGVDSADAAIGDEADDAISVARGITELGQAAVGACELVRDGAGWQQWVNLALEAIAGVAGAFGPLVADDPSAVREAPPELVEAQRLLESEAGR